MAFPQKDKPASLLGYYRLLSPSAGVRVSPLCLGTLNFGEKWKAFMGECSKKTSFEILDHFYTAGGNFIDTANNYQGEDTEIWLGEWMSERGNRDEIVLATKFTTSFPHRQINIKANYQGNHSKSLRVSVEASLKKLQTSYIDLLYVHWWDFTTSIPELMQSLNNLVISGKVLYLGISDTPAWIVSKANEYARGHGLAQFCVYQGFWNAAHRDFEREILQMCEAEGLGIAPWGVLGRGLFKEREEVGKEGRKMDIQTDTIRAIFFALDKVAKQRKLPVTSIALAYIRAKTTYVYPVIGCRKVEHLQASIDALAIELTEQDIEDIESAAPFDVGFPLSFLFEFEGRNKWSTRLSYKDIPLVSSVVTLDVPCKEQPPKPHAD